MMMVMVMVMVMLIWMFESRGSGSETAKMVGWKERAPDRRSQATTESASAKEDCSTFRASKLEYEICESMGGGVWCVQSGAVPDGRGTTSGRAVFGGGGGAREVRGPEEEDVRSLEQRDGR